MSVYPSIHHLIILTWSFRLWWIQLYYHLMRVICTLKYSSYASAFSIVSNESYSVVIVNRLFPPTLHIIWYIDLEEVSLFHRQYQDPIEPQSHPLHLYYTHGTEYTWITSCYNQTTRNNIKHSSYRFSFMSQYLAFPLTNSNHLMTKKIQLDIIQSLKFYNIMIILTQ